MVRVNKKAEFWSELHLKTWWVWSEPRVPADSNCRSPQEKDVDQNIFMQTYLGSFIQLKT